MQTHQWIRRIARSAAVAVVIIVAAACSELRHIKEISITSCSIISVTPRSLRSADAVLALGVHNPSVAFTITGLEGGIRKGDTVIAEFAGGPVAIARKSDEVYELPCSVSLTENTNLLKVAGLVKGMDFTGYMVDITAEIMLANGMSRKLNLNDISVQKLVDKARKSSSSNQ